MCRRYWYASLAVVATFLGVAVWLGVPPREPIYQGRAISYWIDNAGRGFFETTYFPQVDSNAIPYLTSALRRHTGPLPGIYATVRLRSPAMIQKHLPNPTTPIDWLVRANAAEALGSVGTNSPPAVSGLLRALKTDNVAIVRLRAVEALQNVGHGNPEVVKAIIAALKDRAPEVRDAAGDALWRLEPITAKALLK